MRRLCAEICPDERIFKCSAGEFNWRTDMNKALLGQMSELHMKFSGKFRFALAPKSGT